MRLEGDARLWWKPHQSAETQHAYDDSAGRGVFGGASTALQAHVLAHLREGAPLENAARDYLNNLHVQAAIYHSHAAGCRVVGYDGGGGRELFEAPGAEAVAEARPLQLADRAVELATGSYDATLGRASRAWIAARYSPQRTTTALRDAVAAALTAPGKACVATHPARWFATIAPDFAVSG